MLFVKSREAVLREQRSLDAIKEAGSESPNSSNSSMFLTNPPDDFSPENLLSDELKKLSYDDRLRIEEEIHGVGCRASNETPQLIDLSLAVFDDQVNKRKETDTSCAFLLRNVIRCWPSPQANGLSPSKCYLNDTGVRLRFLRCERFDVEKAVQRFIDFLDFMSELFGEFVTERPVCLGDFTKEEELCLTQSRNQFLPFRDRSGRRVLAGVGNCNFHMDPILRYKIFMYLFWIASEDIETQIKGAVILCWAFDEKDDRTWENRIRAGAPKSLKTYHLKQNKSLPVRVASWQHYYLDTPYFRFLASLYTFTVVRNSPHKSIFKVHFGSEVELRYKLASYGVAAELLPMSSTGTIKFDNHRDWLNVIRTKATVDPRYYDEIVECPRFNDVVYRKGPANKQNAGNTYYRELIQDYSLEHFTGDRTRKYEITKTVMQKIEERGGRFLEWKDMWVVYRDQEAIRKKIASAFKQFNRGRNKRESEQLIQAIAIATDLGENSDEFTVTPDQATSAPRPDQATSAVVTDEDSHRTKNSILSLSEYAFLENRPSKRRKANEEDCGGDLDGNCYYDSGCFGKCFFHTSDTEEDAFPH